jgi:hypothetical protein
MVPINAINFIVAGDLFIFIQILLGRDGFVSISVDKTKVDNQIPILITFRKIKEMDWVDRADKLDIFR